MKKLIGKAINNYWWLLVCGFVLLFMKIVFVAADEHQHQHKSHRHKNKCLKTEKHQEGKCLSSITSEPLTAKQLYTCPMHPEFQSENKDDRCSKCGMKLVPVKLKPQPKKETTPKKQLYTCPMHPEFQSENKDDRCPKCGMKLVPVKLKPQPKKETTPKKQLYTCSMHPEVRLENKDDKCPICGMNLIPIKDEKELQIPQEKLDLYGIKLSKAEKIDGIKTIVTVGNFEYDERNICEITSKIKGWVKKLYMNFEGAYIQKHHKLALIYSPELGRLHTELIFYRDTGKEYEKNYKNIIEHFNHLGLSKKEINRLNRLKKPTYYFWIDSPCEGIITKKYIFNDSYINEGDRLYEINSLKNMWFMGKIFESDIELLHILAKENTLYRCPMHHNVISKVYGICPIHSCHMPLVPFNTDITITINHPLLEGGEYSDYVELIYPQVEEETRTIKFRVNVPNKRLLIKKGAFANATIKIRLKNVLAVPETAIVFTGDSDLVFVYKDGKIIPRNVKIGGKYIEKSVVAEKNLLAPFNVRYVEILSGIKEGEEIISSGTFLIDAESQLRKIVAEMGSEHKH